MPDSGAVLVQTRLGKVLSGLLIGAMILSGAAVSSVGKAADQPVLLDDRSGLHEGYARLVFAGSKGAAAVPFTADASNGVLTLHFAQPVTLALHPLLSGLEGYARDLVLAPDGRTLTAHLTRQVRLAQAAADPSTFFLDLIASDGPDKAHPTATAPVTAKAAPPKKVAAAAPAATDSRPVALHLRVAYKGGIYRLIFSAAQPIRATTGTAGGSVQIAFDRAVRLSGGTPKLPRLLRPLVLARDGSHLSFTLPAQHHVETGSDAGHFIVTLAAGAPAPAPPPPPAAAPAYSVTPPPPAQTGPSTQPTANALAAAAAVAAAPPILAGIESSAAPNQGVLGADGGLKLYWTQTDAALSLRFDWQEPVAASVFRRDNALWIVFDKAAPLDLSKFAAQNLPVVTEMVQQPTDTGLALRLLLWSGFNASVKRAGNAWIIDLVNGPQQPEAPIHPRFESQDGHGWMIFPALDPGTPIRLTDPEAGDTLVAVPLPQLGQGIGDKIEIPNITTLASAQGLAFKPVSDALEIRSDAYDVAVGSPDGLIYSPPGDSAAANSHDNGAELFHFADWAGSPGAAERAKRYELQAAIAAAAETERNAARLELAKFYVANALGAEALGVLKAIENDQPDAFDEPLLRSLRACAEELMNRIPEAAADLSDKQLNGRADAALWRAVVAADQGYWPTAVTEYDRGKATLAAYPPVLRRRLEVKLAEVLIDAYGAASRKEQADNNAWTAAQTANDTKASAQLSSLVDADKTDVNSRYSDATGLINDVLDSNPSRGEADAVNLLQGRIDQMNNDDASALSIWQSVANSPLSSLAQAEAGFGVVMAKLDAKQIDRAEAIAELDRLRFSWRGDEFEVRILRKLGELQILDGAYRDGLMTLRKIPTDYPDSPQAQEVTAEMQDQFTGLFIGPNAAAVAPVTALALYDEFKELTPPGPRGDAVLQALADRLVAVDLLDQAANLLAQQLTVLPPGEMSERISTQLAIIQLLNGHGSDAAQTLSQPTNAPVSEKLARQRRELLAAALLQLEEAPQALALIAGDTSPDAERLRTDINWKTQNWPAVAGSLLKQLKPVAADGTVDAETENLVINAATAMAFGGDQAGLANLKQTYGPAMDKTDARTDFDTLVGGVPSAASLDSLGSRVTELDSFLSVYRQRLTTTPLSGLE